MHEEVRRTMHDAAKNYWRELPREQRDLISRKHTVPSYTDMFPIERDGLQLGVQYSTENGEVRYKVFIAEQGSLLD